MYLCVRQMTVIIENTTPMAKPRSTLRTTTDSHVTTQTICINATFILRVDPLTKSS